MGHGSTVENSWRMDYEGTRSMGAGARRCPLHRRLVDSASGLRRAQNSGVRRDGVAGHVGSGPLGEIERACGVDALDCDVLVGQRNAILADLRRARSLQKVY